MLSYPEGAIAYPCSGGECSILGSVSGPQRCSGCQLTLSQSVGEWPSTFFFLSRVCWSVGVFWPFLPRVRSLPGRIPSNSTTYPSHVCRKIRIGDDYLPRCNIDNPKWRSPAAQSTRNTTQAGTGISSIYSYLPWRIPPNIAHIVRNATIHRPNPQQEGALQ